MQRFDVLFLGLLSTLVTPGNLAAATTRHICFAGGGFGTASKSKAGKPELNKEAKKLLKKHKNDVDAASSDYFRSKMLGVDASLSVEAMHEARVAATWDTVALFLPQDYKRTKWKVEPYVERRLNHIVTACRCEDQEQHLLDVGCGDGAIVPYLGENCVYSGCDLSAKMVDLGKKKNPKMNFWVGSFPQCLPTNEKYDVILFNGSLQFFRDTGTTLSQASTFLTSCGRIVLSHVNGANFVKEEVRKNPLVAVRAMPNNVSLAMMAELNGLRVVDKSEIFAAGELDLSLDDDIGDFYLVVLEKLS